jgi:hypothetical protein
MGRRVPRHRIVRYCRNPVFEVFFTRSRKIGSDKQAAQRVL